MRKKRKSSEAVSPRRKIGILESIQDSGSSISNNIRFHLSLGDYSRLRKRCKECGDDGSPEGREAVKSCRSTRLKAIAATAPVASTSSSLLLGRGLKRKVGCIEASTQMGRKNKFDDDYVSGKAIGRGKFGSVLMCMSKVSGKEFACKTLKKSEETVHREVEIMQHLSGHPGVVTLESVYEDFNSYHLVMELCPGGRLIDQMSKQGSYSEYQAARIFKELMLVIKYCHEMGVVHRDVKPENILLTASGKIKLADFGLAMRITNGQKLRGLAGSPAYVAPEVISGDYSEKVDIWSAGVLLHALLVGVLPFQGDSLEAVFEAIQNKKLDFHSERWESVSKLARDLLDRILTREAEARLTAEEVLSDPWITFHTERTLRSSSFRSRPSKPSVNVSSSEVSASLFRLQLDGNSIAGTSSDEEDDSGLVDAITVAISHVRISEPKRSRICSPSSPIREQCSSNLMTSNLCKAF